MNAGLLCTNENLSKWFTKTYPDLNLYREGCTEIFSHEVIILLESYLIGGKSYDLCPLWKKFMRVDKNLRYKYLVVLGYKNNKTPNYHSLYSPENKLEYILSKAKPISEYSPCMSNSALDIRDPLSALLKSHYKANIQDLLTEGWKKTQTLRTGAC